MYVKARKRLTVHQAPNILTITLKRFQSGRFGKLNKKVTFPDKLDLTPYMSATDGTDQYNLYAVVVHLDMLNASFFGHYICYIKDRRGHWLKIDDCKVMFVDKGEVHAQGAYMLLYSRRTARPGPLLAVKEPIKQEKQCEVPPSNGENHSIQEDVPVKCVSFVNSSEDLRADSLLFLEQVLRLLKMFASNGKSIDGLQFSSLFLPRHFIIAMLKVSVLMELAVWETRGFSAGIILLYHLHVLDLTRRTQRVRSP